MPEALDHDTTPRPALGLVGIGLLGTAIAERLARSGYRVLGWDIDPDRRDAWNALGGTTAVGVAAVFRDCSRVLLCLPTDEVVAEVLQHAADALRSGQIVIDTSTGAPDAAVAYLDATVSGSSQQVRDGTAVLLVGAVPDAFNACRDLFEHLAARTFPTGPPGTGATLKLVTNLVLGLNRSA